MNQGFPGGDTCEKFCDFFGIDFHTAGVMNDLIHKWFTAVALRFMAFSYRATYIGMMFLMSN